MLVNQVKLATHRPMRIVGIDYFHTWITTWDGAIEGPPPCDLQQVASDFMASCDLRLALACKKAWYSFQASCEAGPGLVIRTFTWVPSIFAEFVQDTVSVLLSSAAWFVEQLFLWLLQIRGRAQQHKTACKHRELTSSCK